MRLEERWGNAILRWLGIAIDQDVRDLRAGLQNQVQRDVEELMRIQSLESDLGVFRSKSDVALVHERIDHAKDNLGDLEQEIETVRLLLGQVDTDGVARLVNKVESLGEDVETLETQMNDVESRVDDIESNGDEISDAVEQALADVDWSEKLTISAEFEVSSY